MSQVKNIRRKYKRTEKGFTICELNPECTCDITADCTMCMMPIVAAIESKRRRSKKKEGEE